MAGPDWSLYRAFGAVLRQGSLTAAARELRLSQPTIGRRIAALEARLGYALFVRAPEGLVATPEAEGLRSAVEAIESAAIAFEGAAGGHRPAGDVPVRISASEVIAAEVLPHALRRLRQADPSLIVEVSVSNEIEDVLRRGSDLAVRMARPQEPDLLARKVGEIELGLFAHSSCFQHQGPPGTVAELFHHPLVGFQTSRGYTAILQFAGQALEADAFTYRSDNDLAQLGAVRAGLGIGVCHAPLAQGLLRVLPEQFAPRIEMWLVINRDLMRTRRYREVFRVLSEELRRYAGA